MPERAAPRSAWRGQPATRESGAPRAAQSSGRSKIRLVIAEGAVDVPPK